MTTEYAKRRLARLLDALNESLRVEYTLIIHYPRLVGLLEDEEARRLVLRLGQDSMRHANIVAAAIQELGGTPQWGFDPFPEGMSLAQIFELQLEKEKLALYLHQRSCELADSPDLEKRLRQIATEEEYHINTVQLILGKLVG